MRIPLKVEPLAPCRWRGTEYEDGKIDCHNPSPATPAKVTRGLCYICTLREAVPEEEEAYEKKLPKYRKDRPCRFLGSVTEEKKDSIYCGSLKNVSLYECAALGRCTPSIRLSAYRAEDGSMVEVPWCPTCEKYEEKYEEK